MCQKSINREDVSLPLSLVMLQTCCCSFTIGNTFLPVVLVIYNTRLWFFFNKYICCQGDFSGLLEPGLPLPQCISRSRRRQHRLCRGWWSFWEDWRLHVASHLQSLLCVSGRSAAATGSCSVGQSLNREHEWQTLPWDLSNPLQGQFLDANVNRLTCRKVAAKFTRSHRQANHGKHTESFTLIVTRFPALMLNSELKSTQTNAARFISVLIIPYVSLSYQPVGLTFGESFSSFLTVMKTHFCCSLTQLPCADSKPRLLASSDT